MTCPFVNTPIDGGLYRHDCPQCGASRITDRLELVKNCPKSPDLAPAAKKLGVTMADVSHYAQAVARWTAAGFPVRDQAEVERIERELCKPCEKYTDGRCKQCGCRVNQSSLAVANKIKMATEHCKDGKW